MSFHVWKTIYSSQKTTMKDPDKYKDAYLLKDLITMSINHVWPLTSPIVPYQLVLCTLN
jgi:hypothetical protein